MADFLKKLGQGISTTSKNVRESVDTSRKKSALKRQINKAEDRIRVIKLSIGDAVYAAYDMDKAAPSFADVCKEIDGLKDEISGYEVQIMALDGFKICDSCGEKIPVESVFCSKCGSRQPERVEVVDADDIDSDSSSNDEDNMISL